jgi:hypothetical protein
VFIGLSIACYVSYAILLLLFVFTSVPEVVGIVIVCLNICFNIIGITLFLYSGLTLIKEVKKVTNSYTWKINMVIIVVVVGFSVRIGLDILDLTMYRDLNDFSDKHSQMWWAFMMAGLFLFEEVLPFFFILLAINVRKDRDESSMNNGSLLIEKRRGSYNRLLKSSLYSEDSEV